MNKTVIENEHAKALPVIAREWLSCALECTRTIGLFQALITGPRSLKELVRSCMVDETACRRLLLALSEFGIIHHDGNDNYEMTGSGATICGESDSSLKDLESLYQSQQYRQIWSQLPTAVRSGSRFMQDKKWRSRWEQFDEDEQFTAVFQRGMACWARQFHFKLLGKMDLASCRRICDVGGGNGELLRLILESTPHAEGVLLERPNVAEMARTGFEACGLSDRVKVVSGDMFSEIPKCSDFYLLAHVLIDWNDEDALAILSHCSEVIGHSNAQLLVLDQIISSESDSRFSRLLDLHLMQCGEGRVRTECEFVNLFAQSDFKAVKCFANGMGLEAIVLRNQPTDH